ncbi:MAG: ElyC/SanA/YdcF family protein [Candidatus Andersenbacteria bacterium]|nr:ElyC/SanA/YdcF family protein [bacterium]MDZ4225579.1 ElyC/SanA/YdcF family protein [Candidatus Andersenbacteria bacterium]
MSGRFPRLVHCGKVSAIFVWGRAVDEGAPTPYDDGVLKLVADLYRQTGAPVIIPGYCGVDVGQGGTGYPGPQVWRGVLKVLGVPGDQVISGSGCGHNTKTEMDDFLDLAMTKRWRTILAVTQVHNALRAMLGAVKSMANQHISRLMVVPMWPVAFDWGRECYGSQGEGPFPRTRWVDEEFDRIVRYQAKGDLASLTDLYAYLMWLYRELQ